MSSTEIRHTVLLLNAIFTVAAIGDIIQWNSVISSQNPPPFSINQIDRIVTITAPAADSSQIFSFEAFDANGPADIDLITVAPGVGGTIRVQVNPATGSGRVYGAHSVRTIDLSNAANGQLSGLNLSGNLGRTGANDIGFMQVSGATSGSL